MTDRFISLLKEFDNQLLLLKDLPVTSEQLSISEKQIQVSTTVNLCNK